MGCRQIKGDQLPYFVGLGQLLCVSAETGRNSPEVIKYPRAKADGRTNSWAMAYFNLAH